MLWTSRTPLIKTFVWIHNYGSHISCRGRRKDNIRYGTKKAAEDIDEWDKIPLNDFDIVAKRQNGMYEGGTQMPYLPVYTGVQDIDMILVRICTMICYD